MTLIIAVECALKYFSIFFLNHHRKSKQAVVTCMVITVYVFIFENQISITCICV